MGPVTLVGQNDEKGIEQRTLGLGGNAQRVRDCSYDKCTVDDRWKLNVACPVGEQGSSAVCRFQGEATLAISTRTSERDKPMLTDQRSEVSQLLLTANETDRRDEKVDQASSWWPSGYRNAPRR